MTTTNEYYKQAQDFLDKHQLNFSADLDLRCPPAPWAEPGGEAGLCYEISLIRDNGEEIRFPFWNSIDAKRKHEEPTAYGVLACISGDLYWPETFRDFCSDYGYDPDSHKAHRIWKRGLDFSKKLNGFFTEEEKKELEEIQ